MLLLLLQRAQDQRRTVDNELEAVMNLPKLRPHDDDSRADLAKRGQLVQVLFDALLGECTRAAERMAVRDISGKGEAIHRALAIVAELELALDFSVAPELCLQLQSLYMYIQECLVNANRKSDAAPLKHAERVLHVLRDAFAEATQSCAEEDEDPDAVGPSLRTGLATPGR